MTLSIRFELPADLSLVSIYPHAHYLARDMRVAHTGRMDATNCCCTSPIGTFNWQDEYTYSTRVSFLGARRSRCAIATTTVR